MSDLYLHNDNEAAMMAALDAAGLVVDGVVQVVGVIVGALKFGISPESTK